MSEEVKCYFASSMRKIMPDTAVFEDEICNLAFPGEEIGFQIVFRNETKEPIQYAKIEIDGEIKNNVKIFAIDFVPLTTFPNCPIDDYIETDKIGLVPDKIRPFRATDIALCKNQNKACYVSVDTAGLKCGNYTVRFSLLANAKTLAEKSFDFEVIDCTIAQPELKLTNWMHYDCISNYHGVNLFDDGFYRIFDEYLKEYVNIGYNMLFTPLFTPPLDTYVGGERKTAQLVKIKRENGKYIFDFADLEKFIDFSLAHGIKYFEFSHLFTQWGGKACPKIVCEENGEIKRIFGWDKDATGEEYSAFLDSFLPELVKFLKNKNIDDVSYFHLTDEPKLEDIDKYAKCRESVKRHLGNIKILDAISEAEFSEKKLVDVPVPFVVNYESFKKLGANDLFTYYCLFPVDNYYSNRLLFMPLQRARILGIQLYANETKGFLHWGFNFYNSSLSYFEIDPNCETDAGGLFPSGDAFIVYPDKNSGKVNSSLRAKTLKNAIFDYKLLCTVQNLKGKDFVRELLNKNGVEGFTVYPRDYVWHDKFVSELKNLIKNCKN